MSAIYAQWNLDGAPVDATRLSQVRAMLQPYGPDRDGLLCRDEVTFLHFGLHTTVDSERAPQPYVTPAGTVVLWDGRLDNRDELLEGGLSGIAEGVADVQIVAAQFERWGMKSLARLLGDFALCIWNPADRCLILARDFMGATRLYYAISDRSITCSSTLDPLVRCAGHAFVLREQYLAEWVLHFPAPHLTPYVGIEAVPPASYVAIHADKSRVEKFWDFNPDRALRRGTDQEYEEQLRNLLGHSVRRRLRSAAPVLAELSGGMDSSAVVCTADRIIARGLAEAPRLDTVSYFDDAEPNWNERPYVAEVERQRGHMGCHISLSEGAGSLFENRSLSFAALPGTNGEANAAAQQLQSYLRAQAIRVVLSGIGGDEVLGGIPNPIPELANYVQAGQLRTCCEQMSAWALSQRKPLLELAWETAHSFLPACRLDPMPGISVPDWIRQDFLKRSLTVGRWSAPRFTWRGPAPSFQDSLSAIEALRRQLSCSPAYCDPPYKKRYPYLDRELREFLVTLPPQQLLRPGQRRSLMRRSLAGIVPESILNRKRKAYIICRPALDMARAAPVLLAEIAQMPEALLQMVDATVLRETVLALARRQVVALRPLLRIFALACWLRVLARSDCWNGRTDGVAASSDG